MSGEWIRERLLLPWTCGAPWYSAGTSTLYRLLEHDGAGPRSQSRYRQGAASSHMRFSFVMVLHRLSLAPSFPYHLCSMAAAPSKRGNFMSQPDCQKEQNNLNRNKNVKAFG